MTGRVTGLARVLALAAGLAWVAGAIACGGCGRSAPASAALPDGAEGSRRGDASAAAPAVGVADRVREDLWARAARATRDAGDAGAAGGDADDLARLADREGASGLVERGRADTDHAVVLASIRAMAFAPEPGAFAGLPFLAEAARGSDDALAQAALESALDLAARPRRQIDPEDAAEMKEGCDDMVALAKDAKAARARRVAAIRALRMLADRGCVDPASLPTDLDAH